MFSLKNKTAIVTGGGSGIGKAIAQLFAKQEATVYILDFDEAGGAQTVSEIKTNGGKAQSYKCDVSNQQQVKEIIDSIANTAGNIDILINNAGVAHIGNAESTSEEDFTRLFNVN